MGELCRKCKGVLSTRRHNKITDKQLSKKYYFTEWKYCNKCKTIYLIEENKVYNKDILREVDMFKPNAGTIAGGYDLYCKHL